MDELKVESLSIDNGTNVHSEDAETQGPYGKL